MMDGWIGGNSKGNFWVCCVESAVDGIEMEKEVLLLSMNLGFRDLEDGLKSNNADQ